MHEHLFPPSPEVPKDFLEKLTAEQQRHLLSRHPVQQSYIMSAALLETAQKQAEAGGIPVMTLAGVIMKHHQVQAALIEWGRTQAQFIADPRMQTGYTYWDGLGRQDPQFRRMLCEALVNHLPEPPTEGGEPLSQEWGQLIMVDFGAGTGGEA